MPRDPQTGLPQAPIVTLNSRHGPLTATLRRISGRLPTKFGLPHTAVQVTVPGPTSGVETMLEFDADLLDDVIAVLTNLRAATRLDTAQLLASVGKGDA